MRIWSLHPRYLDPKGLVALWRETLLAQAVLHGETRGYTRHPQLLRFQAHPMPQQAIAAYLWAVHAEAARRGYRFDGQRIRHPEGATAVEPLAVTQGQLAYEWQHLGAKLAQRSPQWHEPWIRERGPLLPHPLFHVVAGPVESWEKA